MIRCVPVLAALAVVGSASACLAETPGCGRQSALYLGDAGLQVWVTRKGSMIPDDPLRPLSKDPVLVLQVLVKGRSAAAYGPDASRLVQAVSARQIEETYGAPVRWEPAAHSLPDSLVVASPDGSLVLGPLRFAECGDASKGSALRAGRPPVGLVGPDALRPAFGAPEGQAPGPAEDSFELRRSP